MLNLQSTWASEGEIPGAEYVGIHGRWKFPEVKSITADSGKSSDVVNKSKRCVRRMPHTFSITIDPQKFHAYQIETKIARDR